MNQQGIQLRTIEELANEMLVTPGTVKNWVRRGRFPVNAKGEIVFEGEALRELYAEEMPAIERRMAASWEPGEIRQFLDWHEVLDGMTWLLKVAHSDPADIKPRKFSAEVLFINYLIGQKPFSIASLGREFPADAIKRRRAITDDLKRGWYNELAFHDPPRSSSLGMSFRDIELNKINSANRFAFPSWRITQAYYCTYFYLRAVCQQKTGFFRLAEHNATVCTFRSSVQKPLERLIWKFPFSILYEPGVRIDRSKLFGNYPHLRFGYSNHPRGGTTPKKVFEHILSNFRRAARRAKHPNSYGVFDFLRDFRVWANYQNIDDLLNLYGSGYKAFLDQNLSLLLFFIGGISELAYMSCFSAESYIQELQSFYNLFACNNDNLKGRFLSTPLMQRLAIFKALGIVSGDVTLQQDKDINVVSLPDFPYITDLAIARTKSASLKRKNRRSK